MTAPSLTLRREIKLSQTQKSFRQSTARFRAFVGGRGAGKSQVGALDLVRRCKPNRLYLIAAPDYTVLMDASFRSFLDTCQKLGVPIDVKRSLPPKATIRLAGGDAEILFRSMDDPEKRRGPNLSGAWLDEASQMDPAAYDIVIASLREAGEMGWLSATFTPKGRAHWTYDVFGTGRPDTELFHCKTSDNPFLPPEFYSTIAKQYGEASWLARQELGGEFVNPEGALIKLDWFNQSRFEWVTESGPGFEGVVVQETGERYMHGRVNRVMVCDPSLGGKGSDRCAIGIFGIPDDHSRVFVLHMVSKRLQLEEIVERLDRLARAWRVDVCLMEANGFQVTVAKSARNKLPCPVREIDPEGKSKVVRAMPMVELAHTKRLMLPNKAEWLYEYQDEMCSWSGVDGERDDCVDVTAYAVRELMSRRGYDTDDAPTVGPGKAGYMPARGGRAGY